jgi:glyoxylase-like metal-dependent hydrolase (beta-lactamase superfamily II)
MPDIHLVQTGHVKIKKAQRRRKPGGLVRVLVDTAWTEWLPIYAWVIDHPEGTIVVDTGDTARTTRPGYFPRWHPYYLTSVRMDITPEQEIGPQLRDMGVDPGDVQRVVITHFHTDHSGGLHHFEDSEFLVHGPDFENASGFTGRMQGYLPHRWPDWFDPRPLRFESTPVGPFEESCTLTDAGDVVVVPTPGHTPGHVSVIVRSDGISYFLAGDTSYTQDLLLDREPDGVSPDRDTCIGTLDTILEFARNEPTVYLPSHDPDAPRRLKERAVVPV